VERLPAVDVVQQQVGDDAQKEADRPRRGGDSPDPLVTGLGEFRRRVSEPEDDRVQHYRNRDDREEDVDSEHHQIGDSRKSGRENRLLEAATGLPEVEDEEDHDEPEGGEHGGPVFANLVVTDEVDAGQNRAERERVDHRDEVTEQDDSAVRQRREDGECAGESPAHENVTDDRQDCRNRPRSVACGRVDAVSNGHAHDSLSRIICVRMYGRFALVPRGHGSACRRPHITAIVL